MKKEVILRVMLDTDKDSFGIHLDTKGFGENSPQQDSLMIASILQVAINQELAKFNSKSEGNWE